MGFISLLLCKTERIAAEKILILRMLAEFGYWKFFIIIFRRVSRLG